MRAIYHAFSGPAKRVPSRSQRSRRHSANVATIMTKILIGTSGWTYDGWRGLFYPQDLSKKHWLRWYAQSFSTAEINGSFYRTPSLEAVRGWRDQTPRNFVFA